MPTRNVVLTDHHESLIASLVESGRYQNSSEVLREGLRLVEAREAEDAAKLEALREAVRIGDEAFERGDYKSFPTLPRQSNISVRSATGSSIVMRNDDESKLETARLGLIEWRAMTSAEEKLDMLRAAVQRGIDDLEQGNYREFTSADDLRAYFQELSRPT